MEARGLRPSHVAGLIDQVVFLVFVPTQSDLDLIKLSAAQAVVEAQRELETPYVPNSSWWSSEVPRPAVFWAPN
jgi:hypothetical protein